MSVPALWALLDLDAFFVSVERAKDPSLIGLPVIVGGDPHAGRGIVASASYEARRRGVRTAMPVAQAARLCPDAVFRRPDFHACSELSGKAREILETEAPEVFPASIDEFYLDFSHRARFDPAAAFEAVARLRSRLAGELALPSSAGIAATRLVAKIACGLAKPDGQILVPRGTEAAFLAPLPIEAMPGIGPKSAPRFAAAGFRTIGDLRERKESDRREFLGPSAEYWFLRAGGEDLSGGEEGRERSVGAEETFERDLSDPAEVEAALSGLSETACFRLRQARLRAAGLALKIRYEDFETISASRTFREPTDAYDEVRRAASECLARRWDRSRKLRLLGVRLTRLEEDREGRLPFPRKDDKERRAFAAVDRVKEKFGEGSVHFARGTRRREKRQT
jgi:DNA polymerase-4